MPLIVGLRPAAERGAVVKNVRFKRAASAVVISGRDP